MGKRKGKKKGGRKRKSNPSASAVVYKGPFRLPKHGMNQNTTLVEVSNIFAVSSNGSGVFAGVVGNNLASFLDTTSYTNVYDEWRCLSLMVTFIPNAQGAVLPSVAYAVTVGVVDNDNSTALTSLASGADYESAKMFSLTNRNTLKWKMSGVEDAAFLDNSGTSTMWFKYYSSGLTASTTYGQLIAKGIFQFRGRI